MLFLAVSDVGVRAQLLPPWFAYRSYVTVYNIQLVKLHQTTAHLCKLS